MTALALGDPDAYGSQWRNAHGHHVMRRLSDWHYGWVCAEQLLRQCIPIPTAQHSAWGIC